MARCPRLAAAVLKPGGFAGGPVVSGMSREHVKNLLDRAAKLQKEDRRAFIEATAKDDPTAAAEAIDLLATLDDSLFMNAPPAPA